MEEGGIYEHQRTEQSYGIEENVDGSASSVCSLTSENGWSSYGVRRKERSFPGSFLTMYQSNQSTNGCEQTFEAFPFIADDQPTLDMILSKIKENQKGSSPIPGRMDDERNSEFVCNIATKKNNEFKPKIKADNVQGFDDGDDHEHKFWVHHSEKLCFTEEELKNPNKMLKNVTVSKLRRMKLADLCQPSFSIKIVWRNPELAQVKIDVVMEVISYDQKREPRTTSVTYPVQFTNFGEHSFISADKKRNRKAIDQLSRIFEEARRMLEEEEVDSIDSIIEFLSHGEHLTADDVQNLSKSKERASELLRHVLNHEEVMPAFLEALRSTGNPQNMKLWELITKPKQKEETSATQLG